MGSLQEALANNENGIRDRFIKYALENDPKMKDFSDFKQALLKKFSSDPAKKDGLNGAIEERDFIDLFNDPKVKARVKNNTSDAEYEKMYEGKEYTEKVENEGDTQYVEVKDVTISGYTRSDGVYVRSYTRSYSRYTKAQTLFLKNRLDQDKNITINEFIGHFKQTRPKASLLTKIYRLSKIQPTRRARR